MIRKELHQQTVKEEMEEFMFLGLRLVEGVSEQEFLLRFQKRMDLVYGEQIRKFIRLSLMERVDGRLRLTPRGMDVSNVILSEFLLEEGV